MKLTIGVVLSHGFPVPAAFFNSYARMQQGLLTGEFNRPGCVIDAVRLVISHAFPTDAARNEIVRIFLDETETDHLLFLDADMTHPADMTHRLLRHRSQGESVPLDIITARYVVRKPPFFTVAMRKTGPGPREYQAIEKLVPLDQIRGVLPIDAAGAGALLLSRRLLTAIRQRNGDEWFKYQVAEDGLRSVSEDMWLFESARAMGYQPYLDADTVCGHVASFEVNPDYHKPYADAFLRASARVEAPAAPATPASPATPVVDARATQRIDGRPAPSHWPRAAVPVGEEETA